MGRVSHTAWVALVLLGPLSAQSAEPASRALPDLVADIEKSVALLTCPTSDGASQGSGFVVDAAAGLIATNYHVIDGATSVSMTFAGGDAIKSLGTVYFQPSADLAIVKIPADKCPPALPLAVDLPRKGQDVIALGSPQGLTNTLSRGVVSAVLPASGLGEAFADSRFHRSLTLVQTDAAIAPGSSGGPLLNTSGEVVGMVSVTRVGTQAANFAVAVNELRKGLDAALKAKAVRPFPMGQRPRPNGAPRQPNQPAPPAPNIVANQIITLPTGDILDIAAMFTPRDAFSSQGQTVELKHVNGKQRAWIQVGVTGTVAWFYDTGMPAAVAEYYQDRLHGKFLSRDKTGNPSLYADFEKGKRHGWQIGFIGDQASLVTKFERGKPLASYMIGNDGQVALEHSHQTADVPGDAAFAALLKETDERYRRLRTDERSVRLDSGELVNSYRRRVAAKRAQQSRQEVANKDNARRSAFFKSWLLDAKRRGF